ncbi:hypothetical protein [Planctomicrobium sp. SH527]|uniref:hypothetical protein n=1 Tax=Planctomicrobium sp. SH527 TaxID=3448123 RepID=UPI003F5B8BAB
MSRAQLPRLQFAPFSGSDIDSLEECRIPHGTRCRFYAGLVMKFSLHILLVVSYLLTSHGALSAAEPIAEFLQGLRGRKYFDTGIEYVATLQDRKDLPPRVYLERALLLAQAAPLMADLKVQEEFRTRAMEDLKEFLRLAPTDSRAIQARGLLGQLLLGVTADLITDDPGELSEEERQKRWRAVILESRGYLTQTRDRYQEIWESFPVYLPEEEVQSRSLRRVAEEALIRAQLELAQLTYWESQTYPKGSEHALKLAAQAGFEFEAIHHRYRSQTGGLIARLWQARCFQSQGDAQGIRIALGIYSEILEHDGASETMQDLQDRALRFRLVCLNTEYRRDYALIIDEAEEWLDRAFERSVTPVGVAIQWELCLALESRAESRNVTPEERLQILSRAEQLASQLSLSQGSIAKKAALMLKRLTPVLEETRQK